MAHLTYKGKDGQTKTINNYKVNNIILKNETGDDPTSAISQKATTDAINDVEGKVEQVKTDLESKVNKTDFNELEQVVDEILAITVIDGGTY